MANRGPHVRRRVTRECCSWRDGVMSPDVTGARPRWPDYAISHRADEPSSTSHEPGAGHRPRPRLAPGGRTGGAGLDRETVATVVERAPRAVRGPAASAGGGPEQRRCRARRAAACGGDLWGGSAPGVCWRSRGRRATATPCLSRPRWRGRALPVGGAQLESRRVEAMSCVEGHGAGQAAGSTAPSALSGRRYCDATGGG